MKRYFIIALAILILIPVGFALHIRLNSESFVATDAAISEFTIAFMDYTRLEDFYFPGSQEILDAADLVAIVRPRGKRTIEMDMLLSDFILEEVLAGDSRAKPGDIIYIYEPVYVNLNPEWQYINLEGNFLPMQTDRSYLVLLSFFDRTDKYTYSEKDLETYLLTSEYFGEFAYEGARGDFAIARDSATGEVKNYVYEQSCGYDAAFYDSKMKEAYLLLKEEIFLKLGIAAGQ